MPGGWYGIRFLDCSDCNSVLNNVDISGAVNAVEMDKASISVIGSNIHHNTHYGILLRDDSFPLIKNSQIKNNNIDGIRVEGNCGPVLYDNYIKDNRDYGLRTTGLTVPLITKDNIFTGNTIGVYIDDHSKPNLGNLDNDRMIDIGDGQVPDDGLNLFVDNYLYDIYNNNRNIIKAQNNFWNTTDALEVDGRVFDDEENYGTSGEVKFRPLGQLENPNASPVPSRTPLPTYTPYNTPTPPLVCTSTPTSTPTPFTEISGQIYEDQTWEGAVSLKGIVTIPRGITVIINPGTVVMGMNEQTFLNVLGTLYVEGDEGYSGRVKFVSTGDNQYWGGVIIRDSHYVESELRNAYFKYCRTGISVSNSSPTLESLTFEKCNTGLEFSKIPLTSPSCPTVRRCWFGENADAVLINGETKVDLGTHATKDPGLNIFHNNTRFISVPGTVSEFTVPAIGNYFSVITANGFARLENEYELASRVNMNYVDVIPTGTVSDGKNKKIISIDEEEVWAGVVELENNVLVQGKTDNPEQHRDNNSSGLATGI